MFDVDGFKFKAVTSNLIHQTSNIKEKGTLHDNRSLRATAPATCGLRAAGRLYRTAPTNGPYASNQSPVKVTAAGPVM